MSKVAIIGDTHFSPRTPVSRKDDYPNTLLRKLESLRQLCIANGVSDCIFLGDLINANQMSVEYLVRLYRAFKDFKDVDIHLHTCVGNHDLPHGNPEYFDNSVMELLFNTLFENTSFVLGDVYFDIKDYYTPVETLNEEDLKVDLLKDISCKILCGHYFYLNGFNDVSHTLTPEVCKKLPYKYYFLGHDHTPYEPLKINGYEVHRPGSFSRATSDTCQVTRNNIQICLFDIDTHNIEYVDIPNVLPSEDVYKETKLIEKLTSSSIDTTLSEDIDNLIKSMSFDFSSDIYVVLDSLELNEEVKNKVTEYLIEEGLFRK